MAYVARRPVTVVGRDGKKKTYQPNDEIPDFADWPEVPKRAHLNMNMVELVGAEPPRKTYVNPMKAAPAQVEVEAPKAETKKKTKKGAKAS